MAEDMQRARRLVADGVQAFNRGDFDRTVESLHPDVVWHRVSEVEAPLRGREAVRSFMEPEVFDRQQVEIISIEIIADCVLIEGDFQGLGRGSGIELTQRGWQLWRIRDGLAIEFRYFLDRDEAVQAARAGAA
jgi:ketosteroid isomerase-like protein